MSKLAALATITFALFLLFAACGGDDNPGGTVTASPAPNASLDAEATQQLRDLAGKWGAASTKITYDLTSTFGSLTSERQVIVYRETPDRRIDYISDSQTTTVIVRPDLGYSCIKIPVTCGLLTTSEAEAAIEFPFINDLGDSAGLDAIIAGATALESVQDRNVIGRQTKCLTATGDLGGNRGEATWCFSEEGLLLSINYAGAAQTFEMAATAIEGIKVTDFDPPYPVATIPPTATP